MGELLNCKKPVFVQLYDNCSRETTHLSQAPVYVKINFDMLPLKLHSLKTINSNKQ